jgi:hypothetical protein
MLNVMLVPSKDISSAIRGMRQGRPKGTWAAKTAKGRGQRRWGSWLFTILGIQQGPFSLQRNSWTQRAHLKYERRRLRL